ncbi:ion transporter [Roseiconus lacunae]|uniref:Ion transporter n=1 Tax=Roseiconus lacunae TaxID=2605694 RepID=A0ABT7PEL4_9BACT|nr:ion transporter [Roseiconus lacunae]MCD0460024.1 ion transporter [Roseiconus lacunae]MDM4014930.1 ion transporter [Roseiconus lacunae]
MSGDEATETSSERADKVFGLAIQVLIVLSVVAFSIETLPNLSSSSKRLLRYFEWFTVSIFTVEYLVRVVLAKNKIAFVTSFFGVVDLLSILPFYLSMGLDLRSIRILRILRLFRILKLARYTKALDRFARAIAIAREELAIYLVLTFFVIYLSAVGIYFCEHQAQPENFRSVFHCLWWAVVTLTTVGYGDIYPITIGGRIFTFLVLLAGLGIVSVPAGMIATALSEARADERDR